MQSDLYIQDYSYRLLNSSHQINTTNEISRDESILVPLSIKGKIYGYLLDLNIDTDNESMPSRKSKKLMRKDSVAAYLTAQEIIKRQGLSEEELSELLFYVLNGNCLDQVQEEIAIVAKSFLENNGEGIEQRNAALQSIMPPLFALKVLTNGTQSVIAQDLKIKGSSTTLGNTSHAFFDSLFNLDAFLSHSDERALISCSTGAGLYTFFNHQNSFESDKYRLALCASSLLISKNKKDTSFKISERDNKKSPASFHGPLKVSDFSWVNKDNRSDSVIYTGVPADEFNRLQVKELINKKEWKNVINLSEPYGYLGTSSLGLSIITAIEILKKGENDNCIDLVNIDPFGKECLIKVERV